MRHAMRSSEHSSAAARPRRVKTGKGVPPSRPARSATAAAASSSPAPAADTARGPAGFYCEEHLRQLWQNALVGMRLANAQGRVLLVNDTYCRLMRQSRAALEGQLLTVPYRPEQAQEILRRHRHRFRDRAEPAHAEVGVTLAGGQQLRLEVHHSLVEMPGQPTLLLSVFRDITARIAAQAQAQADAARLRMALEAAGMVAWEWDLASDAIEYSVNATTLAGGENLAPYSTMEGMQRMVHPEDRPAFAAAVATTLQDGAPFDCEYRMRRQDQDWSWIHGQGRVIVRVGGQPMRFAGVSWDVTARKLEQARLQESELRYRLLFERSPHAILEQDLSGVEARLAELGAAGVVDFRSYLETHPGEVAGLLARVRVVEANQRADDWLGRTEKGQLTRAWRNCLTAESLPVFREQVIALAEGQTYFQAEMPVRDGRREPRLLDLQATVLFGHEVRLARVLVSFVDITARRGQEREVLKLSRAVEQSPASVVITDPGGRIEYVNARFTDVTGYRADEVLGQNPRLLKSGAMSPETYAVLWQTITSGREWRGEFQNRRKDGQLFWELASISPIVDRNGRVTHFVAVKEDITEHKRDLERLAASEQRFRTLFETAPVGLALLGPDGHYLEVNQAYQAMLGTTAEEILRLGCQRLTHPDDAAEGVRRFEELRAGRLGRSEHEKRYMRPDGRIVWAHCVASAVKDSRGRLQYILSIVEDITARKRTAESRATLARLVLALSAAATSDAAAQAISAAATELFAWDACYLNLLSPDAAAVTWLVQVDTIAGRKTALPPSAFRDVPSPLTLEVIRHGARLVNLPAPTFNVPALPPLSPFGDATQPSASMMFVPLRSGGTPVGVFSLQSYTPGAYTQEDLETLQSLADACGGALERIHAVLEQHRLEREVLEAGNREQTRIGCELHDGVTQTIGGAALRARMLADTLAAAGHPGTEEAERLTRLLNELAGETRRLARGLAPVGLEVRGLPDALDRLSQDIQSQHRVPCSFSTNLTDERIQPAVALHLFRIAQEAVANALQHGRPSRLELALETDGGALRLAIGDDGAGFNPASATPGQGRHTMRYRAGSIGAELKLHSRPGGGTRVECHLPVSSCWQTAPAKEAPHEATTIPPARRTRARPGARRGRSPDLP
jgi:PAS domain S-box-containing protein